MKSIFTEIYLNNYWDGTESRSGPGSSISETSNIIKELPRLLKKYNIYSMIDAPCGDMNWMSVLLKQNIFGKYIGMDIVPEMIDRNTELYQSEKHTFRQADITVNTFPSADLLLCRDCLFHFSYNDFWLFIDNFLSSDVNYILTTTHVNRGRLINMDIPTGSWYWMDLLEEPYNFPHPITFIKDGLYKKLCLWSHDQIHDVYKKHQSQSLGG